MAALKPSSFRRHSFPLRPVGVMLRLSSGACALPSYQQRAITSPRAETGFVSSLLLSSSPRISVWPLRTVSPAFTLASPECTVIDSTTPSCRATRSRARSIS